MFIVDPYRSNGQRTLGFLSPEIANTINSSLEIAQNLATSVQNVANIREQILNPPSVQPTYVAPQVQPALPPASAPAESKTNWPLIIFGTVAGLGILGGIAYVAKKKRRR